VSKVYVMYDSNAMGGNDTDNAQVLTIGHSMKEVKRDAWEMKLTGAIYEYDEEGNNLINETWKKDIA